MLKLTDSSIIFVHCPAGVVTGGAELLHQLVSELNDNGRDARIVYFGDAPRELPADYRCYNVKIAERVDDAPQNVEVLYEGCYHMAFDNRRIQKVLWWLSVDNFYKCSVHSLSPADMFGFSVRLGFKSLFHRAKRLFHVGRCRGQAMSLKKLRNLDAVNGFQSEYARDFLERHGFENLAPLKDFINTEHIGGFDKALKDNVVLYNPKKGAGFTRKLIAAAPDIHWVPLQGMSRARLIEVMRRAKLYIDFGNHPGKDRLPRECAMNGCCVITGMRGSAAFYGDVMIGSEYKFDEKQASVADIIACIRRTLADYDNVINDFARYRDMISSEKEEFACQVKDLFL